MEKQTEGHPPLKLYGRKRGRPLSLRAQSRLAASLSHVFISLPENGTWSCSEVFAFFPVPVTRLSLEIGFGSGERLVALAQKYPEIGFIGAEVFLNGVSHLLGEIERLNIRNIIVFQGDARAFIQKLPNLCFDEVTLPYPDPWPKHRHSGRRFIQEHTISEVARILTPQGRFLVVSDSRVYIDWTLACMKKTARDGHLFSLSNSEMVHLPFPDWVRTRYEHKALSAGRAPTYLAFARLTG